MDDLHVTIKPGVVLEGAGASKNAIVLAHKPADNFTDVVLCLATSSPYHPYVVWTYNHESGKCFQGDYFKTIEEATARYTEREF